MKTLCAIAACALLLSLGACSSGNGSQQSTTKSLAAKKSVFDGYVKDVDKAKQVEGKLSAAQKKMQAQLKQAESGNGSSGQQPPL